MKNLYPRCLLMFAAMIFPLTCFAADLEAKSPPYSLYATVMIFLVTSVLTALLIFKFSNFYVIVTRKEILKVLNHNMPFQNKIANDLVIFSNINIDFVNHSHCVILLVDAHLVHQQTTHSYSKVNVMCKLAFDRDHFQFVLTDPLFMDVKNKALNDYNKNEILRTCKTMLASSPVYTLKRGYFNKRLNQLTLKSIHVKTQMLVLRIKYILEDQA